MKQLYISCVQPIFEYDSPVQYHKLISQWKNGIQKVQNTGSGEILRAFRSVPVKEMQQDTELLQMNTRKEEIHD